MSLCVTLYGNASAASSILLLHINGDDDDEFSRHSVSNEVDSLSSTTLQSCIGGWTIDCNIPLAIRIVNLVLGRLLIRIAYEDPISKSGPSVCRLYRNRTVPDCR